MPTSKVQNTATKHLRGHSRTTKSSGNQLPGLAGTRPPKAEPIRASLRPQAHFLSDVGAAKSPEQHRLPLRRAGSRPGHQEPHHKALPGMADPRWVPRSTDHSSGHKNVDFCQRHPWHFPEVPAWLRAVTSHCDVYSICWRALCGAVTVSVQETCCYTAWKLH